MIHHWGEGIRYTTGRASVNINWITEKWMEKAIQEEKTLPK